MRLVQSLLLLVELVFALLLGASILGSLLLLELVVLRNYGR